MTMAMCEDFPCCGHTPQDPCEPQFYDTPAYKQALYDRITSPDYDPYYDED